VHAGQADVGRHGAAWTELLRQHGAECGVLIVGLEAAIEARRREEAREHVVVGRTVVGRAVGEGADLRELVHHAGHARQVLAHVDAGEVGRDFLEVATHLDRRVGLHVERVNRAQAALEEDVDAGFERRQGLRREGTGGCGGLGSGCVQSVEVVRAKSQQRDAGGLDSCATSKAGMPERTGVCCHDRGGS